MIIRRAEFYARYTAELDELDEGQVLALEELLDQVEQDQDLHDVQQLAYILATVRHETGDTWRPVREVGRGKGHWYGEPCRLDAETSEAYYGRGYVQLTGLRNYARMSILLGVSLVERPDILITNAAISYRVLSWGMTGGLFTGRRLDEFIPVTGEHADYVNARRVVNGLDRASLIAGYAERLELVLRASASLEAVG